MCQRAKSPRYVRENVPEPKPPTGAPCQYPSSIIWEGSSAGFRPPAFSKGCPMARFHAALGMLSPAKTKGWKAIKQESNNPADTRRAEFFTRSSDLIHPKIIEKTIFYIRNIRIQVRHREHHQISRTLVNRRNPELFVLAIRSFALSCSAATHYNRPVDRDPHNSLPASRLGYSPLGAIAAVQRCLAGSWPDHSSHFYS